MRRHEAGRSAADIGSLRSGSAAIFEIGPPEGGAALSPPRPPYCLSSQGQTVGRYRTGFGSMSIGSGNDGGSRRRIKGGRAGHPATAP